MMKLARYAAGLVLLAALFYFRLIDLDELRKALAHPGLLMLTWALCVLTIPVAALRWHILLRAQGLKLQLLQTMRIVAVGAFFATFLPGSAGGDLVRGVYIYQASHGRRTSALLSIFIDRLIGLSAFVIFGVGATLTRPAESYGVFEYSIFAFAFLFALGIVVLFAFGHRIAQLVNRLFTGRSHKIAAIIDDAGEALHQYSRQWPSVLLCLAISLLIVLTIAVTVVVIANATEFGGLSAVEYGIAGIYAMIANSLPFTPGGLGIGEGAFASACVALEPAVTGIPYGTIFLVLRCVIVLSTLPGLLAYLFYPHRASLLAAAKANP
jgi:uncharacterized protein (TIRG00374 family)